MLSSFLLLFLGVFLLLGLGYCVIVILCLLHELRIILVPVLAENYVVL